MNPIKPLTMILSLILTACAHTPKYSVEKRITHAELQTVNAFDIEIEEDFEDGLCTKITYIFQGKEFNYKNYHKNYQNPQAQEEMQRFNDLLCVHFDGANNCNVSDVTYRTIIINKANNEVVIDETISNPYTNASYYGRWAVLSNFNLKKGNYSVLIQTTESNENLDKLTVKIGVGKAHHGK